MSDLTCRPCLATNKVQLPSLLKAETPSSDTVSTPKAPTNYSGPSTAFLDSIGRVLAGGQGDS